MPPGGTCWSMRRPSRRPTASTSAQVRPDFAALSFYKIIGFPTGIGCLLMRRDRVGVLSRPWFAGGTITIASVAGDGHYLRRDEAAFEDGTVDYLNLPAVTAGLAHIDRVGLDAIHRRAGCLTGWLLEALGGLRHQGGRPTGTALRTGRHRRARRHGDLLAA